MGEPVCCRNKRGALQCLGEMLTIFAILLIIAGGTLVTLTFLEYFRIRGFTDNTLIIGASAICVGVLLLVIGCVVYQRYNRKKRNQKKIAQGFQDKSSQDLSGNLPNAEQTSKYGDRTLVVPAIHVKSKICSEKSNSLRRDRFQNNSKHGVKKATKIKSPYLVDQTLMFMVSGSKGKESSTKPHSGSSNRSRNTERYNKGYA